MRKALRKSVELARGIAEERERERLKNVVLWDMNNTPFPFSPSHPNQFFKFHRILFETLKKAGYRGCTMFKAYGDIESFSFPSYSLEEWDEYQGHRCYYNHISKNGDSFEAIMSYLKHHLVYEPPPLNCLLISSDERFLSSLNELKMVKYNILLARNENATRVLDEVASKVWSWEHLLERGKLDCVDNDDAPWAGGDFSNADTIGWWDMDSTPLPIHVHPHKLFDYIRSGLRSAGYEGNFILCAYGDRDMTTPSIMDQLLRNPDFFYTYSPSNGAEDATSNKISTDILMSAKSNDHPTNYLLISNDLCFDTALDTLRGGIHNALWTRPPTRYSELDEAWRVWEWNMHFKMGEAVC